MTNKAFVVFSWAITTIILSSSVFAANSTLFLTGYDQITSRQIYDFGISLYNSTGTHIYTGNITSTNITLFNSTTTGSTSSTTYTKIANWTTNASIINNEADLFGNTFYTGAIGFDYGISAAGTCKATVIVTFADGTTQNSSEISWTSGPNIATASGFNTTKPVIGVDIYAKRTSGTPSCSVCGTLGSGYSCIGKGYYPGYMNISLEANKTYTVYANYTTYATTNESYSLTSSYENRTFSFYQTNTILFYVRDENTGNLITSTNASIQLAGTILGYNYTTSGGQTNATLLIVDNYIVTVSAPGYGTRQYLITISNNTVQYITLYLLQDGYNTFLLSDVDRYQPVQGYQNSLLRLNSSGSNYYEVERCVGDSNGQCVMSANICTTTNSSCPFYRIVVYNPSNQTVGDTGAFKFSTNSITLLVNKDNTQVQRLNDYLGLNQYLTSFNNTTGVITYYLDNQNNIVSSATLTIQRRIGTSYETIETISTSGTGTILIISSGTNLTLGDEFIATATYNDYYGNTYVGDRKSIIPQSSGFGSSKAGVIPFVGYGLVLAPLVLFGFNPVMAPIGVVVMIYFTNMIGLASFTTNIIGGVAVIFGIVLWLLFK